FFGARAPFLKENQNGRYWLRVSTAPIQSGHNRKNWCGRIRIWCHKSPPPKGEAPFFRGARHGQWPPPHQAIGSWESGVRPQKDARSLDGKPEAVPLKRPPVFLWKALFVLVLPPLWRDS